MTPAATDPLTPATDPAAYRYWIDEHVRFADLDMLGHVNNKSFNVYAESGRVAFLAHTRMWESHSPRQNVIARIELDYHAELHFPAQLRIGVRVLTIGRSSFRLGLGMFHGERCVASAVTVLVRIDQSTRAPQALDADERARLEPYC